MGWAEIGRVPVAVRPRTPGSLLRIATVARSAARRQPERSEAGASAREALADADAVEALLARCARLDGRLRTETTAAYLRWRYGNPALGYRIITGAAGLSEGCAIFRVRRRGRAREATLCDAFVPPDAPDLRRVLELRVLRETRADYLLRTAMPAPSHGVGVRMRGQGPLLTWRGITETECPPLERWDLVLGDLEMF
jgi:hypothetical protein